MSHALHRYGLWSLDWTEVPGLDDLAWPSGPIREAERRFADAFGAAGAALLVGGSTAGLLAAVLAFGAETRPLGLGRTNHRSVYGAMALGGFRPLFLDELRDAATGYSLGLGPDALEAIRRERPSLVVVPYPTYQGVAMPLRALADACHEVGAVLLADAAHGAHFGLDPRLPPPALDAGADVAVLGLHKSLGSLTQTAALVWQRHIDGDRLRSLLRIVQSSSPSYPLMASVDAARAAMEDSGRDTWRRALDRAERVGDTLGTARWRAEARSDPSRLVWLSEGQSGAALLAQVRAQGIEPEYADDRGVLMIVGPNLRARDLPRVRAAIAAIGVHAGEGLGPDRRPPQAPSHRMPVQAMGMLAALRATAETVSLAKAVGRVSSEFLVPYPPGVPAVLPGQRLDEAVCRTLADNFQAGWEVQGVASGATIRVVAERGTP